MTDEYRLAN